MSDDRWLIQLKDGGETTVEEDGRQMVYEDAAIIINRLAETIDDRLREGFLTADSVRSILKKVEKWEPN